MTTSTPNAYNHRAQEKLEDGVEALELLATHLKVSSHLHASKPAPISLPPPSPQRPHAHAGVRQASMRAADLICVQQFLCSSSTDYSVLLLRVI